MIDPKQYVINDEAYTILMRCSEKKDMSEWDEWRYENKNKEIYLQGADFNKAYLEGVDFSGQHMHLEGAHFIEAYCKKADFSFAHCEKSEFLGTNCRDSNFIQSHCEEADFSGSQCKWTSFDMAHCERANFFDACIEGTSFCAADIDKIFLWNCSVDEHTDFRMTNLFSAKIEPGKRAFLERNIRYMNWKEWYNEKWLKPDNASIFLMLGTLFLWILRLLFIVPVVRFFWYISNYGYSTCRILLMILLFIFVFAGVYTNFPDLLDAPCASRNFAHMLFFSTATMITLGFSNINVAQGSLLGMVVVTGNLLVGYFMLAVLVTRLAVLFQTMAPGYVPPKECQEKHSNEQKSD